MLINRTTKVIKSVFVIVLFAFFIVSGCKGKEEKQITSSLQPSESGKTVGHQEREAAPEKESPSLSREMISDNPPKITSIKINPEQPAAGDKIKAEIATFDKDGDNVMLTFHWSKNGTPLLESSDTLLLAGDFKRGDRISLAVVPDDGKRKGNPSTIAVTIANRPPLISDPAGSFTFSLSGRQYTYLVNAVDPEGDTLTYSLKSAPPGMTVDSATGLVKWNVPSSFNGKAAFTVSVSDSHGGEASQSLSIEIKTNPQ